jgi:hypothetical protein
MSRINLQSVAMQMYEDTSLTDELTDTPAQTLLQWGRDRLTQLADRYTDDFESAFKSHCRVMKTINRFTWKRLDMDIATQREYLEKYLVAPARDIGHNIPPGIIEAYLRQQSTLDEQANVQAMIDLFKPSYPVDYFRY